jgi:hypothetical protein
MINATSSGRRQAPQTSLVIRCAFLDHENRVRVRRCWIGGPIMTLSRAGSRKPSTIRIRSFRCRCMQRQSC